MLLEDMKNALKIKMQALADVIEILDKEVLIFSNMKAERELSLAKVVTTLEYALMQRQLSQDHQQNLETVIKKVIEEEALIASKGIMVHDGYKAIQYLAVEGFATDTGQFYPGAKLSDHTYCSECKKKVKFILLGNGFEMVCGGCSVVVQLTEAHPLYNKQITFSDMLIKPAPPVTLQNEFDTAAEEVIEAERQLEIAIQEENEITVRHEDSKNQKELDRQNGVVKADLILDIQPDEAEAIRKQEDEQAIEDNPYHDEEQDEEDKERTGHYDLDDNGERVWVDDGPEEDEEEEDPALRKALDKLLKEDEDEEPNMSHHGSQEEVHEGENVPGITECKKEARAYEVANGKQNLSSVLAIFHIKTIRGIQKLSAVNRQKLHKILMGYE